MAVFDWLVAYYAMNNWGLTTDSKGTYNLTNTNSVSTASWKIWCGADFWTANTNKVLEINWNLWLTSTWAKSISWWVKMNTEITSSIQTFFWLNTFWTSWSQTRIEYDYNGWSRVVRFWVNWWWWYVVVNNTVTLWTTNWNHFVVTYSWGSNWTITWYVNGSSIWTATANISWNNALPNKLQIGALYDNLYSSALIDEVWIWNREITSWEVTSLYNLWVWLQYWANTSNFFMFF